MVKLKAAVVAAVVGAVMLTVSVAYGGVLWSGEDPVLDIGGHTYNVTVNWPQGYECDINGPIEVEVEVPQGVSAQVLSEASTTYPCGVVSTQTEIEESDGHGKSNAVWITAEVSASKQFPIQVNVDVDGSPVTTCRGTTNKEVKCAPVSIR